MYAYLKMTIKNNHMTLRDFSNRIGISERALLNKINGKSDWLYGEYRKICEIFPNEDPQKLMERI